MSMKPGVTFLVLALFSTAALAQSAAPPAQTPPPTQAPPSKTPPAKTPPAAKDPAPPAQTPSPEAAKPPETPPKPAPTTGRRPRAAAKTQIVARDVSGTPLEGVELAITGAGRHDATTNESGIATLSLPDGQYRVRFAHDGFVTLEK
jgi:hypothetical protein